MQYSFLIAGLGNPGPAYAHTRHNVGYQLIEAFAASLQGQWENAERFKAQIAKVTVGHCKCLLVKPQRFMNESGLVLQPLAAFYHLTDSQLVVLQDDIHLPKGGMKISIKGGSGGHNGLANILQHVGQNCIRFRIGIGQKPFPEMDLKDYVLGGLTRDEQLLLSSKFPEYIQALKLLLTQGVTAAT